MFFFSIDCQRVDWGFLFFHDITKNDSNLLKTANFVFTLKYEKMTKKNAILKNVHATTALKIK